MKPFELKRTLFGAEITARITVLDEGVHVLLTGGERSHVGAAALARNGEPAGCISVPGHREQALCEHWAQVLSRETGSCAAVACGIHYDNAAPEQIDEILHVCSGLLAETLTILAKEEQMQ